MTTAKPKKPRKTLTIEERKAKLATGIYRSAW